MPKSEPSPRQQLAQRIADFIVANQLANPFGGDVYQNQRHYGVLMSIPRVLDGEIRVYGPKFIQVRLQGPMASIGSDFVYESEQNALDFLRLYLVEHNRDAALAVPTKAKVE